MSQTSVEMLDREQARQVVREQVDLLGADWSQIQQWGSADDAPTPTRSGHPRAGRHVDAQGDSIEVGSRSGAVVLSIPGFGHMRYTPAQALALTRDIERQVAAVAARGQR